VDRFEAYLRAGQPVIWVNTLEPHRAERELAEVAKRVRDTTAQRWDVVGGLHEVGAQDGQACAPTKAIALAAGLDKQVVFLHNFHRFLQSVDVIQAVQNAIPGLKARGSCLVILSPDAEKLPQELTRHVVVWDFPLPGPQALTETMGRVATDAGLEVEGPPVLLVEAALGLTAAEAEDAFALSVVEKRALDPAVVAREKAGALLRQAKIQMEPYPVRFEDLGGLEVVKEYTLAAARSPMSLGILLLGPPGTGKSHFAKALGNDLGIPTLSLDFGRMMGSLVGQSLHGDHEIYFCDDTSSRVERKTIREAYEKGHLGYTFTCSERGAMLVRRVLNVIRHERKAPFVRLITQHGKELLLTGNHCVFRRRQGSADYFPAPHAQRGGQLEAVAADQLSPGDRIATVGRISEPRYPLTTVQGQIVNVPLTIPLAELIGLFLGDGSLNNGMIRISCGPGDEDIITALKAFGPLTVYEKPGSRGVDCTMSSFEVASALHSLGICGKGKGARTKRVPAWLFGASDEIVAAVVRGYYSADGSFSGHNLEVSTVSPNMAKDMVGLLARFGIVPYMKRRWRAGSPYYRLTVSKRLELHRFSEQVSFLQRHKKGNLARVLGSRRFARWLPGRRAYGIAWDQVAKIEEVPMDDPYCYDISVEDTERFFSEWVVVHNSESNIRSALQAVDAFQRSVLFLDEIEKGLAGVQSSGQLDSGTKAGVGSAFLRWMSDREPGRAYIVGTCNDITQLPPEYTRSGRFDATFWLDLPTPEERDVIWRIYEQKYSVGGPRPDDRDWTGAEIHSCCRTAVMLGCDLLKAGEYIIPMAKTQAEKIEALRTWAKGRAIPASRAAAVVSGRKLALVG